MENKNTITVTIPNLTQTQLAAISAILWDDSKASTAPLSGLTRDGQKKKTKTAPLKTLPKDADEDFGTEEMEEEELDEEEDEIEEDESEDEDESEEDEDDAQEKLDFKTVSEAVNTYGETNPKDMKAILLAFNIKNTKELKTLKNKWEPVYRKVMAKLKTKKAKK